MKNRLGILFVIFLMVNSCTDKKPAAIQLSDTICLNLMPGEKELTPVSSRASDAFGNCCKHSSDQNLNRVISAKPHNIFISFSENEVKMPDSSFLESNQFDLLEKRGQDGSELREFLYKAGSDWVYRIQVLQPQESPAILIDFVGRDSILMKKIFNTPRFASMRLQCSQ